MLFPKLVRFIQDVSWNLWEAIEDFNQRRESQSTFQNQLQLNGECEGSVVGTCYQAFGVTK